ncbi:hypothetical protein TrVFT333_010774 [Trichoderma virens FT-333]|nr:hypothetical protein TrVFT333_010774 [Trichoderma virens FT-333]
MNHQVYAARTAKDLKILSRQYHDIQVTTQLGASDRKSSASRWNIRHLVAYRLLIKEEKNEVIVPLFKDDHGTQCPICNQDAICSQKLDESAYQALVGEAPRNMYAKSESELMRLPYGFFWVALSRAARNFASDEVNNYPSRQRKQVQWDGYANSTTAIPGSSSPISRSSSEFDVEMESHSELDEDEHHSRRSKSEDHALSLCLVQPLAGLAPNIDVQPRIQHLRTVATISGKTSIAAEDDGGICVVRWQPNGWEMIHPYLALLEAKRAFQVIHLDEKTGIYHPVTSNEHLAQYLGEAVITWKGNRRIFNNDVFLIAATNTFVSFIHFRFGRDYREYLDADEESQKRIINNAEKEALVYMSSTKWLNLQSREGRRVTLCNILALVRWHQEQGSFDREPLSDQDDDGSTTDSDSDISQDDVDGNDMDTDE